MTDGVLNTGVGNSNADGTVNSRPIDRTGGAIVLPDSDLSPEKVLWSAVQYAEDEKKKNEATARKALSDINNIRIGGWINNLEELRKQQSDLSGGYSQFLQKYRGRSPEEFDPRNPDMAKEALDLQRRKNELQALSTANEQIKQMAQHDFNLLSNPKENQIDEDSSEKVREFYNKPLSEQMQALSKGEKPELQQAYPDWQSHIMTTAAKVKANSISEVTDENGMIKGYSFKGVPKQRSDEMFWAEMSTPQGQYGLKKLQKTMSPDEAITYSRKIWDSQMGTATKTSAVPDALSKKKQAAQWESSGNTVKNDKNILSVFRKENGDTEVTMSHTDTADNKPLTFEVNGNSVTGTPIKVHQPKGKTPELYISVPKGNINDEFITKSDDKVHLVSKGKDADIVSVPYDDFSDTFKNEFGNGELSYYDVLQRVKGTVGSTGTGGGKTETKSSGSTADDYMSKYGIK